MFTKRSTLGSVAVGLIVAATFERFLGTPVGLAATNGLAAGMLAWAAFFQLRNWSFVMQVWAPKSRTHRNAVLYAALLILVTSVFLNEHLQSERAVEIGFLSLFLLVAVTAYQLGAIVSILDLTDDREPSMWGIPTAKGPVLTALSFMVALTAGLVAAAVLGSWLGAPWELAMMNGLAVGTQAAVFAFAIRTNRLVARPTVPPILRPWVGVVFAGFSLIFVGPSVLAYIEVGFAVGLSLHFLFLATGFAAMTLGVLAGSLGHTNAINGNEGARASTPAPEREGTRAARG